MDGEDVFGCKIKVQFVDAASPGPLSNASPSGAGSPMSSSNGGCSRSKKARREGPVRSPRACSASHDSGVKLSSSDDNEVAGEDRAPVEPAPWPCDNCRVESTPCSGDDIVVCGPVEEIDVEMEMPTKDVNSTCSTVPCDSVTTPSKKTKKKKSKCASKHILCFSVRIWPIVTHCVLIVISVEIEALVFVL